MIIPAVVLRIASFIKDDKIIEKPTQHILCYTDQGTPVVLKLISNKNDLSQKDIENYFENKMNSLIKQKEIDSVAGELDYLESFEIELEKKLEGITDRKEKIKIKKEFKTQKALEIVKERRKIKPGNIIRTVISMKDTAEYYTFKNKKFKMLTSRALIFDNEGNPTTSGFYVISQTANTLPISIKSIFNKSGEAINLFTISLSKLATLEHVLHLIRHSIRTINKNLENSNIYVPNIEYNYDKIKGLKVFQTVKEISRLGRIKGGLTKEEALNYLKHIENLKTSFIENPKLILDIQIIFNLMLNKIEKEENPFYNLENTLVNLNFSKENPDDKNKKRTIIKKHIEDFSNGNIPGEIITTYHTPALSLVEPADSWGFMHNNIQLKTMVLSIKDSFKLFKQVEALNLETV